MSNDDTRPREPLPIGQRAWTRPLDEKRGTKRSRREARRSQYSLVFDTETTVDAAQQLRLGCFRILDGTRLVQEGIFHEHGDPAELELLESIREETGIALVSISEFRNWFFHYVYRLRATVVGHNLPFDLSRLAVDWSPARGRFRGGFSFVLWPRNDGDGENTYRPRLRIKALNRRAAVIEFAAPAKEQRDPDGFWPGRFIDTMTLAAALTDRAMSLDQAAEAFAAEHRKIGDAEHGAPLRREYVEYLRRDVLVTEELYFKLVEEFGRHPIELDASKAYSSASIGKAYLRQMGIGPPAERSTVPDEVLGYSMNAFYGGRVECRVRREIVPITYLDVRSMYPTVFSLLGLQRHLTAEQIGWEDATEEVSALLARVNSDDLFEKSSWPELCAICEVEPDGGDILPVRAKYGGAAHRSIGVNYVESDRPLWYSLPDVVASKLLTGKAPRIKRAIRFTAPGRLASLRPVELRGEVRLDPRTDEIFPRVIEERHRVKGDANLESAAQSGRERFLKTFANATSYGIFAELNRQEPAGKRQRVRVFSGHSFETAVGPIETPGAFCYPPIAALITGAARLMLALAEREVAARGGAYAFCDTDSIAVLTNYSAVEHDEAPDSPRHRADLIGEDEVHAIVNRFESLSPFSIPGSILEFEKENFDDDGDRRVPLYAYAVSAKRYVLMNRGSPGEWTVRRFSEHGLGAYMSPTVEGNWKEQLWLDAIAIGSGEEATTRPWESLPAIGQLTLSRPELMRAFRVHNKRYPDRRVRPFNFVSVAFAQPLARAEPPRLIAPYLASPADALSAEWVDLHRDESWRIQAGAATGAIDDTTVRVRSYGEVAREHRGRPELKFVAADGGRCLRRTSGRLERVRVRVLWVEHLGKEGNLLTPAADGAPRPQNLQLVYTDASAFQDNVLPILRSLPRAEVAAAAGVTERALRDILAGRREPRSKVRRRLTSFAIRRARTVPPPGV